MRLWGRRIRSSKGLQHRRASWICGITGLVKSALKKSDGMNKIDRSQSTTDPNQRSDRRNRRGRPREGLNQWTKSPPVEGGEGFRLQGWVRADRKGPTPTPLQEGNRGEYL